MTGRLPVVGAQRREAQSLQWYLSESGWDPAEVDGRRLELLFEDPSTALNEGGVLIIDEHGDRASGAVARRTSAGNGWPT